MRRGRLLQWQHLGVERRVSHRPRWARLWRGAVRMVQRLQRPASQRARARLHLLHRWQPGPRQWQHRGTQLGSDECSRLLAVLRKTLPLRVGVAGGLPRDRWRRHTGEHKDARALGRGGAGGARGVRLAHRRAGVERVGRAALAPLAHLLACKHRVERSLVRPGLGHVLKLLVALRRIAFHALPQQIEGRHAAHDLHLEPLLPAWAGVSKEAVEVVLCTAQARYVTLAPPDAQTVHQVVRQRGRAPRRLHGAAAAPRHPIVGEQDLLDDGAELAFDGHRPAVALVCEATATLERVRLGQRRRGGRREARPLVAPRVERGLTDGSELAGHALVQPAARHLARKHRWLSRLRSDGAVDAPLEGGARALRRAIACQGALVAVAAALVRAVGAARLGELLQRRRGRRARRSAVAPLDRARERV